MNVVPHAANLSSPLYRSDQDVAKFKEVLVLNDIPISRGIFITSSTFSPRARFVGIKCIDGEEFTALEKRGHFWARLRAATVFIIVGSVALGHYVTNYVE